MEAKTSNPPFSQPPSLPPAACLCLYPDPSLFSLARLRAPPHSINTILDSTKILVLRDGVVAEYGAPSELLKDPKSEFTKIVEQERAKHGAQ